MVRESSLATQDELPTYIKHPYILI